MIFNNYAPKGRGIVRGYPPKLDAKSRSKYPSNSTPTVIEVYICFSIIYTILTTNETMKTKEKEEFVVFFVFDRTTGSLVEKLLVCITGRKREENSGPYALTFVNLHFFNVMTNVFLYCLCDAPRENQQCVDEVSVFK